MSEAVFQFQSLPMEDKILKQEKNRKGKSSMSRTMAGIVGDASFLKPAILVFLFALLLRAIYFFQIKDQFIYNTSVIDAEVYEQWAKEIVNNQDWLSLNRGIFTMSPGYPYFLACLYLVFHPSLILATWVQFLTGSLTCVLIGWIANKIFLDIRVGILSGLLYACYGLAIFFEGLLVKATLLNFVNVLFICCMLIQKHWATFAVGVLLGLSAQLRPNVLVLVPIFLAWLFLRNKEFFWKKSILFILGLSCILFPVAYRNYKVGSEFVLTTAGGGYTFYVGNNPSNLGPITMPIPSIRQQPQFEHLDYRHFAEKEVGHSLSWSEASEYWYKKAFRYIRENPVAWLKLNFKKAIVLLNVYEVPINLDFNFFREEYNSILSLPLVSWGIIVPFTLLGMILSFKQNPESFFILFYLIAYFVVNLIFVSSNEYRFPMVPGLVVFSAVGILALARYAQMGNMRKLFVHLPILLGSFWFVNKDVYADWLGLHGYKESHLVNSYYNLGVTHHTLGNLDKAILYYEKGMKLMPQDSFFVNLAGIHYEKGEIEKAKQMIEKAFYNSQHLPFEAYLLRGFIYYDSGDFLNAYSNFKKALELDPKSEKAQQYFKMSERKMR